MNRLPRPVWVIALVLTAALLMASGVVGGTGAPRDAPPWTPIESRATDGGAHEAGAQDCHPARARPIVHDA